jgi:heptosyltransferase II
MQTNYFHKVLIKWDKIKRILIHSPSWIGDAVLCLPTIAAIKQTLPDAAIEILCLEKLKEIYATDKNIDAVITYPKKTLNLAEIFKLSQKIRAKHFDLALLLPNSFVSALMVFMARIPYRLGYAAQLRGTLLTNFVEFDPEFRRLHMADYYFKLTGLIGYFDMVNAGLRLSEEDKHAAQTFIDDHSIIESNPIIVFHPGASKIQKAWVPERYIEVGKYLVKVYDARIVIVGAPSEMKLVDYIQNGIGGCAFSMISQVGIGPHLGIISRAALFIGCDSGYMHAASALGKKLVAMFGPGAPSHTHPLCPSSQCRIIDKALPCQPCQQHFFSECDPTTDGKPLCIDLITSAEVIDAARELLIQ